MKVGYGSASGGSSTTVKPQVPRTNNSSQYFEGAKKGEVNELRNMLKNCLSERDQNRRKEVVKKVIAFMTLGIDVSRLFSEMCMASYTNDISQKKMIYLYLVTYAESHPDLAIMAISTFQKDCKHPDPKIRGLALRNLCSLRFSGSFEYLQPVLLEGLGDLDPYVKKTAIMGCIKLFYIQADIVKVTNIVDRLYQMIRDPDTLVSQNAIVALNEILQDEGGIAINTKMIVYLLNRIKEYNEWGQSVILELVAKYQPRNEQELFDIMSILDERLKQSSSAIVLGCIKIFINFTKNNSIVHKQVYERITAPLITMMTSGDTTGTYELAYTVISHILFIVSRGGNEYFEKEYKQFYCKNDDPTYIKQLKLEILKWIASEINLGDIMNELGEYVTDVDSELARLAIKAIGGIAIRLPKVATPIIKQLCSFINMNQEYITNETIVMFKEILRKYKNQYNEVIPIIEGALDYITEPESKIALIWILGEFGEYIDDSPYILEGFVKSLKEGSEDSNKVKHFLLKGCVQLFTKRAPEVVDTLKNLLNFILNNENEDYDLKDRAVFYCKALQNSYRELKELMNTKENMNKMFIEEEELYQEGATLEFNTLSVIYNKPAEKFIKSFADMNSMRNKELMENDAALEKQEQKSNQQESTPQGEDNNGSSQVQKASLIDLIDEGVQYGSNPSLDALGGSMNKLEITQSDLATAEDINLDPEYFQSQWEVLPDSAKLTRVLLNFNPNINEKWIEDAFSNANIYCIASGEQDDELKFFLYGKYIKSNSFIFMELNINRARKEINLSIKTDNEEIAPFFAKYVEYCLKNWGLLQRQSTMRIRYYGKQLY